MCFEKEGYVCITVDDSTIEDYIKSQKMGR